VAKQKAKTRQILKCPYCKGTDFIKKGYRKKKHQKIQLYYCNHCQKKFTPLVSKYKTYPLKVIIESLSLFNKLHTLEESASIVSEKYGLNVSAQNIHNWLKDFEKQLPFLRFREFIAKKFNQRNMLVQSKMFHGQIYDFKYHRAKTQMILEDEFRHYKFRALQQFLELVVGECPHHQFKNTQKRASRQKGIFNLKGVKITSKQNKAVDIARLVIQTVKNNKYRHEFLEKFMLINDSVTVATEIPILMDKEDVDHYNTKLGFNVPLNLKEEKIITGHIDILQIRNGCIHILDYKPSAKKEKPVDQLTTYALALSRLTGLRLYHFKCAWFDCQNYYEFFPLHVVYKKKKRKKKRE